jgi:hypothetical protein
MTDYPDLDTPVDVIMTTIGEVIESEPDGPGSLVNTYVARSPEVTISPHERFSADLERMTNGYLPGSLGGKLPDPLYVFSTGSNPDRPLEFAKLFWAKGLFVVSTRVKKILESLTIKSSEFYPVSMVYSNKGVNSEDYRGGPIVAGSHWLWWCYATYDLVDVANTRARITRLSEPDQAQVGQPIIDFHHIGRDPRGPPITVALNSAPYDESAAFSVLGWAGANLVLSPAFVDAFMKAGLLRPDGSVLISPTPLDGVRAAQVNAAFQRKLIPYKPPLRVFGTNILAADQYDPPFYSVRDSLFSLPVQDI